MSKKTKIWLVIAASLVLVGCILFGCVMAEINWDFKKLSTVEYGESRYALWKDYKNISIVTNTADIVFVPSENGDSTVQCYEQRNMKHSVEVKEDTLIIEVQDTRAWYEYVGFSFDSPKITVTIPQGEYGSLSVKTSTGDVTISKAFHFDSMDISQATGGVTNNASVSGEMKIKTGTGNIRVNNVSADSLKLSVSTGKVTVTNARCNNFWSEGDTGDLVLKNVVAAEKIAVERDTGDVELVGCDAGELFIETDTGHVKGSLLTDKIFTAESDTGRVDVPKTATGGRCEISTDTGDIKITIQS